jgi:hypothetical protein
MRRRVTRAERAEIIRLYESSLAARTVAERLDVSMGGVLKFVKAGRGTMRPRGESWH